MIAGVVMNYYVLSQKKQAGCPQGSLNAALYDKFYSDAKNIEYGFFRGTLKDTRKKFIHHTLMGWFLYLKIRNMTSTFVIFGMCFMLLVKNFYWFVSY